MKSKFFATSLLMAALFSGLATAQSTSTPRIDQAQQAIGARIQAGLASGHISPSEAQMLIRRDRDILQRENQFKSNGNATFQERQQLRAELNALSADVERMMANHNALRLPGNSGNVVNTPGIDNQEYVISQRIDEGVRLGRISQREARRLQSREREIARHEAFFKSDGVVTRQERRQLHIELDGLRNEVERRMNDDRRERG